MWKTKTGVTIRQLLGVCSNVFLVSDHHVSILVDTSWKYSCSRLQASLDGMGFNYSRKLCALFLTHAHFDHAQNAAWAQKRYQCPVIIQETEAGFVRNGKNPLFAGINSFTRLLPSWAIQFALSRLMYMPVFPDITFNDRLDLHDLGIEGYLQHTPGHTIGSSSMIVSEEIAIVGDTMHRVFPNTAYPPFLDNRCALLGSWKVLLDTHCQIFLPSHGKAIDRVLLEREYFKEQ